MKPHASPIVCENYFVTEMSLSANNTYAPEKDSDLDLSDLLVESNITRLGPDDDCWAVIMSVEQNASPEKNAPYNFVIRLMGLFSMAEGLTPEKTEQLLLTNGSSILFAATREILRDMTSKGPYAPLLLPSLSFFPLPKEEEEPIAEPAESDFKLPEPMPRKISLED